ncbi:MAG: serine protease [Lysobacterales bacterium]
MKRSLFVAAVLVSGISVAQVDDSVPQTFTEPALERPDQQKALQDALFDRLLASHPSIEADQMLRITLSHQDKIDIGEAQCVVACDEHISAPRALESGKVRDLQHGVDMGLIARSGLKSGQSAAGGVVKIEGSRNAWTAGVTSPGATALRLNLTNVHLPEGASLAIYNLSGEAYGPYTLDGLNKSGEFWTHTITGDEVFVRLSFDNTAKSESHHALNFTIARVAHIGPRFQVAGALSVSAEKAFCSFNESCVENGGCYNNSDWSQMENTKDGVAHIQYVSGGSSFICSGGLINDTDSSSQTPYFLTANHCISSNAEASSMEAFWQFGAGCGGSCYNPNGSVPRTNGATLLSTSATGDYTLMRLNENAPSGTTFLGWTASPVANSNGRDLFRISHPKGAPQAYSRHDVSTSIGTCGSWPRGNWIYSTDAVGATEGGSSGSPVLNASGQVVGQLSGGCGPNPSAACDSRNATVDGALAGYFDRVEEWLDPDTTPPGGGGDTYTGSLSGRNDRDVQPDGTYYQSAAGLHVGTLVGPSNADFDLALYRWTGSWTRVQVSESSNSNESISYNGASGYYYWRVYSYSGSGSYTFSLTRP